MDFLAEERTRKLLGTQCFPHSSFSEPHPKYDGGRVFEGKWVATSPPRVGPHKKEKRPGLLLSPCEGAVSGRQLSESWERSHQPELGLVFFGTTEIRFSANESFVLFWKPSAESCAITQPNARFYTAVKILPPGQIAGEMSLPLLPNIFASLSLHL